MSVVKISVFLDLEQTEPFFETGLSIFNYQKLNGKGETTVWNATRKRTSRDVTAPMTPVPARAFVVNAFPII
jgi:hypothetical protein